ncbi:MAG: BtaA family protein [Alphaproteobacteria bacterium]|nr:BtaA family protein [Alphaproteobacteria bacterium]MCW5740090.1 BtaA family protein [Alphaproteobacteria bacterium]
MKSSFDGALQYLFALAFKGLVYPQIWEDPDIDMEALAIRPDSHVVAIASGGCNILSYLVADPGRITAVDLSPAHVALNRLKLAAARELPDWRSFYRFFGAADAPENVDAYWRFLAPKLDATSRLYWERRRVLGLGRRRIGMFARDFYRHGLLGRFIGLAHVVARAYGIDPRDVMRARTLGEQRSVFESALAPLFDKRLVRWATGRRLSLYGLGIPPAQYAALAGGGDMAPVLRARLERLVCGFSVDDNYFAWQAFGRGYDERGEGPLPPYLHRKHFAAIRERAGRVLVLHQSLTSYLCGCPDASRDRYVLLDAQDWMDDADLNALWRQITRTARPGARVIFRTAAEPSLLPGRVDPAILARWRYEDGLSRDLTRRDRSAIYGGFHLYMKEDGV